jgi:hypothetical protein
MSNIKAKQWQIILTGFFPINIASKLVNKLPSPTNVYNVASTVFS